MRSAAEGREAILTPFCHAPSPSRPEYPAWASRRPFAACANARPRHASPDACFVGVLSPMGPFARFAVYLGLGKQAFLRSAHRGRVLGEPARVVDSFVLQWRAVLVDPRAWFSYAFSDKAT